MRLPKEEIVDYCRHFVSLLLQNTDVYVALRQDRVDDDLRDIYKDYDTSDLMNEKQRQIILDVLKDKKMTKQEYLDAIYTILDDKALFEAMLICYDEPVDSLFEVLDLFDRVDTLTIFTDKVFLARFKYVQTMVHLYQKAAHLFGFISVEEVADMLELYEHAHPFQDKKYQRKRGRYKQTIFADPAKRCIPLMHKHVLGGLPWVLATMDGLIVSPAFAEDYEKEVELVLAEEGGIMAQTSQESYDAFFEKLDETLSYRKAYLAQLDLPINIAAFAIEEEGFTMGDGRNLDDLKAYLVVTFADRMPDIKDEDIGIYLLGALADQMCEATSDHNKELKCDLDRGIEYFKAACEEYGIDPTKDEILRVTTLLSLASADQRQWMYRGFSDNELRQIERGESDVIFLDRFDIGGAEAEEVVEVDPESGQRIYRIHRHSKM